MTNKEERMVASRISFHWMSGIDGLNFLPESRMGLVTGETLIRRCRKAHREKSRYWRVKQEKADEAARLQAEKRQALARADAADEELQKIQRDLQQIRAGEINSMWLFGHNSGDGTPPLREFG